MFKHFIFLQWKAFFRAANLGKGIGLKILMGLVALYFALLFLLLGIGLYPMLQELFPDEEVLKTANSFALVWLAAELLLRFMLQALPVMDAKPLLLTPIPKRKIVDYVLLKSLCSFFNLLPLLVVVPFAIFLLIKSEHSVWGIVAWAISFYVLSLSVNLVNFLIKKKFADNLKGLLPFLLIVLLVFAVDYFEFFSVTVPFGQGLDYIVHSPFLSLLPVLIFLGLYKWNQKSLEKRFYLDDSLKGHNRQVDSKEFRWVRKFGTIAPFLQLDLKLIWRNKRPKANVWLSLLSLAYGLFFYSGNLYGNSPLMLVFVGIFMTGVFMINFGQFIPAWDASYYSMMMAQNIPLRKYLIAKAGLVTFSIGVLTILTLPFLYFGWNILVMNLACALFNIGINVPLLLYAGAFNRKRIELQQSPIMNYQGTGVVQLLLALPLFIIPILVFWPVNHFFSYEAGVGVLAVLGFLGITLRRPLLGIIEAAYQRNKYAMVQGFKQAAD